MRACVRCFGCFPHKELAPKLDVLWTGRDCRSCQMSCFAVGCWWGCPVALELSTKLVSEGPLAEFHS